MKVDLALKPPNGPYGPSTCLIGSTIELIVNIKRLLNLPSRLFLQWVQWIVHVTLTIFGHVVIPNSPGIEVYSHANAFFCFVRKTCSLSRWVRTLLRTFWMANYVAKLLWAQINASRKLSVSLCREEYSTGPLKAWAHCLVFRRVRWKQVTRWHG